MALNRNADYLSYLYTCNRCRSCAVDRTPRMRPVCPSYAHFGYFTYTGGGKGYVAQGILEGKTRPSQEVAEVAMNCLLCGACAATCPPGFDTLSFIRDLRDLLVRKGFFINEKHRKLLERGRMGETWGRGGAGRGLPLYTGEEEILVFMGCLERARGNIGESLKQLLASAGMTWGVLDAEPCCGAPLKDLGDTGGFTKLAARNIKLLNELGPERILAPCPHCAATLTNDYMDVADLDAEIVSLPRLIAELVGEGRLKLAGMRRTSVTYHDPCRLCRFLEEEEPARELLRAIRGVDLVEMDRSGKGSWCCGSGAWAREIVPELSNSAAAHRSAEVQATGADLLVTACSYCTDILRKKTRGRPRVIHLADLVAQRCGSDRGPKT